MFNWFHHE